MEEAYRRKCIQLKRRIAETDDENKKMRLRLELLKRAIEHLRLERNILRKQMSEIERRTAATNFSDSEGSPPPPSTVRPRSPSLPPSPASRPKIPGSGRRRQAAAQDSHILTTPSQQPQEKPLRNKRSHRKHSFLQDLGESAKASFAAQDPATVSPSSDGFSRPRDGAPARSVSAVRQPSALPGSSGATNGNGRTSAGAGIKKPNNAYELFSQEMRPQVQVSQQEAIGENRVDVDNELAKGWRGLGEAEQADWQRRFEAERESWARDKNSGRGRMRDSFGPPPANRSLSRDQAATPMKHEDNDGDVAMPDEVEEAGPSLRHGHEGGGNSGGGFTAVNGP